MTYRSFSMPSANPLIHCAWGAILLPLISSTGIAQGPAFVDEPVAASSPEQQEPVEAPLAEEPKFATPKSPWGLAAVMRTAQIPFNTEDRSVSSFVPMMFYEGDRAYLRGLDGGIHLWKDGQDQELNVLGRLRFVDIPEVFQNKVQGDSGDFGIQYHRDFEQAWWEAEAMSDTDGKWYLSGRIGTSGQLGENFLYNPSLEMRFLSSGFTSRYFALTSATGEDGDGAFQISPGISWRYHLFSDVFLLGSLRYTWFSSEITDLSSIGEDGVAEAMIGFGFFQDTDSAQFLGRPYAASRNGKDLKAKPYVRVAHGWGTSSDLGEILNGDIENDEFNNQMTSIFYGHPLTDDLFGAPIALYVSPGIAYHYSSEVQSPTYELILKIKAYYTIHWPIRWRIGAAEGLSWIEEVSYLERINMESKDYRPSQLMNYIDLSLDLNVGDLLRADSMKHIWAGVAVHHRSSIFESASQFGRIGGGSNYPSIYLQFDMF